jgi:hypothetical protein
MSLDRIAQQEVEPLPRWARLALAARCVRRARALLRLPPEQASVLDDVPGRLERAVATATAGDDLAEAAAAAYTLALDNVDSGAPDENDAAVLTTMVAHAAAFAAEAATLADARQAAHLVAQSIDFAIHACRLAGGPGAAPAVAAMRADLERLANAAGVRGDETPVAADFFGPL